MSLQAVVFVAAILLGSWVLLELVLLTGGRRQPTTEPEAAPSTEDVR